MINHYSELPAEHEGVIKYRLAFSTKALEEDPRFCAGYDQSLVTLLDELNETRALLLEKKWLGQDHKRYGGEGFGNISLRLAGTTFLISASQTGHLASLSVCDIALVEHIDVDSNFLSAIGLSKPSSESMTHGICYQSCPDIQAVVHIHAPELWLQIDTLQLPFTSADIPYGTPEMANAVKALLIDKHQLGQSTVFAMKGHQDGIVAVGPNLKACATSLLDCFSRIN